MMPISLTWDTREGRVLVRWNGFLSFGWDQGREVKKLWKIPIPLGFGGRALKSVSFRRMRWVHVKEIFLFLRAWTLRRFEGNVSFPDPMLNGVFYGWLSALGLGRGKPWAGPRVNFLGENWCSGEARLPFGAAVHFIRRWAVLFLKKKITWPTGRR